MALNSVDISRAQRSQQIAAVRQETRNAERQKAEENQSRRQEDKIELSSEAIELSKNRQTQGLQQVQSQLTSGFYNRPDIVRQTAARISQAFPRETKVNL